MNVLQGVAVWCSVVQCGAVWCSDSILYVKHDSSHTAHTAQNLYPRKTSADPAVVAPHCNCNTLQHTATHCNTAAHCNTLQHHALNHCRPAVAASHSNCNTLQHHCNTTATHSNSLQHLVLNTAQEWTDLTLTVHERVDSRFLVLPGSESTITEITEYTYFSPLKPCREFKYKSD